MPNEVKSAPITYCTKKCTCNDMHRNPSFHTNRFCRKVNHYSEIALSNFRLKLKTLRSLTTLTNSG